MIRFLFDKCSFRHTIRGQFYGHTHNDEFAVIYHPDNLTTPISVAFLSPSATTTTNLNPGYRVYSIDASTYRVLDHRTVILNMTQANAEARAAADLKWLREYDARDAYALAELSPSSWSELIDRFESDDALFQRYIKYYHKSQERAGKCEGKCKSGMLCRMRSNGCRRERSELYFPGGLS